MSRGLNKVMIIGHLGREPEMRYTPSGRPVTTFSVATSRSWKTSDGERKTQTEWFNVVAWGSLAEICNQYLSKGQQVYIEGRFQTRRWDDENGNHRSALEVVAKEMIMLGERKKNHTDKTNGEDQLENESDDLFSSGDEFDNSEEEEDFPF
jgi:single-strand DNA-binding protein